MVRLTDLSDTLLAKTPPDGRESLKTCARRRMDAVIEPLETMDEIVECMVKSHETTPQAMIWRLMGRKLKELYEARSTEEEESDDEWEGEPGV